MKINYTLIFLFLAVVLSVIGSMWTNREGFSTLTPGEYTNSVMNPLLYPDYPKQKNRTGLSDYGSEQLWTYYPVFDNSYKQYTNNVKYWYTPNNGQCSPADMCGGLYNNKKIDFPAPPQVPSWDSEKIRVNYYDSKIQTC